MMMRVNVSSSSVPGMLSRYYILSGEYKTQLMSSQMHPNPVGFNMENPLLSLVQYVPFIIIIICICITSTQIIPPTH